MEVSFPVVEIFSSIQGEGCNLGKRANFIRFAGCNLSCPWCDTKWDVAKMGELSIDDICSALDVRANLVVLTGGEPLLQPDLLFLISKLKEMDYAVAIETNGTLPTKHFKELWPDLWIAVSPKPQKLWQIHKDCVYDELKYVIDGHVTDKHIARANVPIWLQPEGGQMQKRWKQALEIQKHLYTDCLDVRIGVQLHKIMEVR